MGSFLIVNQTQSFTEHRGPAIHQYQPIFNRAIKTRHMAYLALVVLLRIAVLAGELLDVGVLARNAHMQGLDVLFLLLRLSLYMQRQTMLQQPV